MQYRRNPGNANKIIHTKQCLEKMPYFRMLRSCVQFKEGCIRIKHMNRTSILSSSVYKGTHTHIYICAHTLGCEHCFCAYEHVNAVSYIHSAKSIFVLYTDAIRNSILLVYPFETHTHTNMGYLEVIFNPNSINNFKLTS